MGVNERKLLGYVHFLRNCPVWPLEGLKILYVCTSISQKTNGFFCWNNWAS